MLNYSSLLPCPSDNHYKDEKVPPYYSIIQTSHLIGEPLGTRGLKEVAAGAVGE
jgi:hypothetical protein